VDRKKRGALLQRTRALALLTQTMLFMEEKMYEKYIITTTIFQLKAI